MIVRPCILVIFLTFTCIACDSGETRLIGEYSICWIDVPDEKRLCRDHGDSGGGFAHDTETVVAAGFSETHIGIQTCGEDGIRHYSVDRMYTSLDRFESVGPVDDGERAARHESASDRWPEYSYRDLALASRICETDNG